METTRREFLKESLSALGFAALPGDVLFAAPKGWKPEKPANLVFGVLSDTHLRTAVKGVRPGRNWSPKYFAAALEYFKARNVDAVVHCGDFAHRGQVEEMQYHANFWNKFFPGGMAPGGHRVEKLFVTGNHDVDGSGYYGFCAKKYPDPDERAKHVLSTDMAANWERIWGEKYEPLWHKEIKGYHFFGRNWAEDGMEFAKMINAQADKSGFKASSKPFFVLTHRRPLAALRKSIARNPNAIAFFGHNHWSVANWNMAYLYGGGLVAIQCASCEPRGCNALVGDEWITKAKIEGLDKAGHGRQGFVVRVYDDMIVFERHEFSDGETSLGPDWVMPFNWGTGKHPFSKDELKKVIGEPQFSKSGKLRVESVKLEGTDEAVRLSIPLADGNPDSRVYAYDVVVVGDKGTQKLFKAVYAAGVNLGMGHEPNGGVTKLDIPKSELPPGKTLTIAARPLSSLGTKGKAIAAEWKI